MSQDSIAAIAWCMLGAFLGLSLIAEAARRFYQKRNARLTTSEWLEKMRQLNTVKPMASRIEGCAGVAYAPKRKQQAAKPVAVAKPATAVKHETLSLVKPVAKKNGTNGGRSNE